MFEHNKRIPEIINPCGANFSEIPHIEILKIVLQGFHAVHTSCAKLQLSLKTMQYSSSDWRSAVTLVKRLFTNNFPSKICH